MIVIRFPCYGNLCNRICEPVQNIFGKNTSERKNIAMYHKLMAIK
ncbi:hypothetical protein HMPREF1604_00081 [Escherichia coli 908519]|nr:hypothetical protein HMPREF1594_03434 [Escherichia coli 907446]ESD46411.1 hypothetical protein HMPREF1604_00081 [Escherichia coli 908519]